MIFKKINKKRQLGTEKNMEPLPAMHKVPSGRTLALSRISILFTVFFWILYIFSIIIRQLIDGPQSYNFTMEAISYTFVVSLLAYSSLMYLIARHGALSRFSKHSKVARSLIDNYFFKNQPSVTVLVPSYNEEYDVVRKTLLSAALQEYPNLRVVLLLDDKPYPTDLKEQKRLDKIRKIGKSIKSFLKEPYNRAKGEFHNYKNLFGGYGYAGIGEIKDLVRHYRWFSDWLFKSADKEDIQDHVDYFFANQILIGLARDLNIVAKALESAVKEEAKLPRKRILELYKRLVWIFGAELDVFERKKYASVSHEPNKAMNLNSYIGLMGKTFVKTKTPYGVALLETKRKSSQTLTIPDSEFILTLDADSILLPEYCLRLVYCIKRPENAKVAVIQTPYSSFRGAFSRIERLAGATTDIQHILHQGMTQFGATFWVGANAIIRKRALEEICETETVNGFEIKRYIQDRTVIEDTESSIDLGRYGWTLLNYPERLSYSATPPDFGSLVVQRRRWANGGLLIIPKFLAQIRERKSRNEFVSKIEIMLRVNYLASIAWATFGLIFLLAYPYDGRLLSPLVLLAALPYFMAQASDLKYCRYKYSDIIRIYGFNLIMLPVNLAGVLKSLEQAITGRKIPFARTPKIKDRTSASIFYVITPPLIVVFSLITMWRNIELQNWGNAVFAGFNAFTATWAIIAYIGVKDMLIDILLGIRNWLYVEKRVKNQTSKIQANPNLDWRSVLS